MRDNEERLESVALQDESTVVDSQNNALSFVSPTELVYLPSQGKMYSEEHPLHNKDTIELKFMTAKEEDILTNKSLIKKGIVIDRMLQSIIVDKNIKIEDLLIGDKNAITVAARISGYGQEYSVSVDCPSCSEKSVLTFDLAEETITKKSIMVEEKNITEVGHGLFSIKLPKSKIDVVFRLLNGKDEAEITKNFISNKSMESESNSTTQLKRIVVSANGVTNKAEISKFVDNMPAIDARFLRKTLIELSPDIEMKKEFSCSSCGHEEEVEIPFTVEFFWPK